MKKILTILLFAQLLILSACTTQTSDTNSVSIENTDQTDIVAAESGQPETETESETAVSILSVPTQLSEEINEQKALLETSLSEQGETIIHLAGDDTTIEGEGASFEGGTLLIDAAGTYHLSGELSDEQVLVNAPNADLVRLILDGVSIHSNSSAPLFIQEAESVQIVLVENSKNTLSDSTTYNSMNVEESVSNAVLFSKVDLSITGAGSLEILANFNDGISSKDGLVIENSTITVVAVDDGIRGKDYLTLENTVVKIEAGGDGLKSDNDDEENPGVIQITDSQVEIVSGGDTISAQGMVEIFSGQFNLTAGNGSSDLSLSDTSIKGIKGQAGLVIHDGNFVIESVDDGLHSNASILIESGVFEIKTEDDGIHADGTLTIKDGRINIFGSYEGLEACQIEIIDGDISIVSSDDGINLAGGNDLSGFGGPAFGGQQPQGWADQRQAPPGSGGQMQLPEGWNPIDQIGNLMTESDLWLKISGGDIVIDALGDGIDSNGSIEMNGGTVLISGPTSSRDGAIDYAGGFSLNNGIVLAAGSAGMGQASDQSSTQPSLMITFEQTLAAGTLVSLVDAQGDLVFSFTPEKQYQNIVISSPELALNETYQIYLGGTNSLEDDTGFSTEGTLTNAEFYSEVTLTSTLTALGQSGAFPGSDRRRP